MHRHHSLELLLVLPDGSRSLIPAAWTDLDPASDEEDAAGILASLAELIRARAVVDALLRRQAASDEAGSESAKEDERADDLRVCHDEPAGAATAAPAARRGPAPLRRGTASPAHGSDTGAKGANR